MEIVQLYVNRRAIGRVLMHDDRLESALTLRRVRPPHPRVRRTCAHARRAVVFAYRRSRDEHWPVAYCEDCLTILAGRDPLARAKRPRWRRDARHVAITRWTRAWPKPGRPRGERPPRSVAWPEAA
jgi:hypothetical protein